jgi:FMN-dependent oxidoreductase (nitrilotriacetate monooxygenase family)
MTDKQKMKLGVSMRYVGYHNKAWRHPDVPADGAIHFKHFLSIARKAEAAKIDMLFLADGLGVRASDFPPGFLCRDMKNVELEPLTLLSAIAACTKHIGLVATASTTYNEPFHIARKFASLDHISEGRAGWNLVTSWSKQEAWNFSRDERLGYDERYDRASEFAEVVAGLWDSWEEDAFLRNKESGIFYDESKLHVLNHKGRHFKVRGPLSCARTPQGRPIIIQAGASEQGRDIAAKYADVIYANPADLKAGRGYYADVKSRLKTYGRSPDDLKIMPGVTFFTGKTRDEAQAKFDQLQDLVDPISGLGLLYTYMGDLTGYDLDGPVPEITDPVMRSLSRNHVELARRNNWSIRQLYKSVAAADGGRYCIGTPSDLVDEMQEWFESGAADGFNVCPAILPPDLDDLTDLIIPELRRRGLFRTEYEGTTMRENLGLRPMLFRGN